MNDRAIKPKPLDSFPRNFLKLMTCHLSMCLVLDARNLSVALEWTHRAEEIDYRSTAIM